MEMKNYFVNRGFNATQINKTVEEVKNIKTEEVLEYKEKKKTERIQFVIQFYPRLRALGEVIQKHFHLLKTSERLQKSFPEPPMVAFKRLKNLVDHLIHTDSNKAELNELQKCNSLRCQCCQHFQETKNIEINGKKTLQQIRRIMQN
jgi:adenylate kinase family enzyme